MLQERKVKGYKFQNLSHLIGFQARVNSVVGYNSADQIGEVRRGGICTIVK
jgi:hypothetical protein